MGAEQARARPVIRDDARTLTLDAAAELIAEYKSHLQHGDSLRCS